MKRKSIFLLAPLILIISCKKDNPVEPKDDAREPEVLITNITESLATADSISTFTNALKTISLSEEDTKDGVTLFAPLNGTGQFKVSAVGRSGKSAGISDTASSPVPDSIMRKHIVKGVHRLADLTNGKLLTGINGNQLKVTRSGDTLWVNGVLVGGKEIISSDNQVVYVVKTPLNNTSVTDQPFTEQDFLTAIQQIENNITQWHKNLVVLDGILSRDAVVDSIQPALGNQYQSIGNFQFTPGTTIILQIWQGAFQNISVLNNIEQRMAGAKNPANFARLKALRAYLYLQLLSYYDNIPLTTEPVLTNLTNTNRQKVVDFINSELQTAAAALPANTPGNSLLNSLSVKVLQARAALLEKNYQKVLALTDEVIANGRYSLASVATIFSPGTEVMWDNSVNLNTAIKSYFFNRNTLPYLRLTEVYLMNVEANIALNNIQAAHGKLSTINQRSGRSTTNIDMNTLRIVWTAEMKREGGSFLNLLRWGTASDVLAPKGFVSSKHKRLPIPQLVIDQYAGMTQNPGY